MSFGGALAGAGNAMGAAEDRYDQIMQRKLMAARQQQEMQMQALQFQQQQQQIQRQQQAAQGFMAGMGMGGPQQPQGGGGGMGVPQQMPLPGARPMPGAPVPQGGGMAPGMAPPPGARIPTPGGAPVVQGPQAQPQPPPMPRPAAGPQQPGAQGGGISLAQFVDNMKQANPNMDPVAMMEAVQAYIPYLKEQDQQAVRELTMRVRELQADTALTRAERAGSGAGESATNRRQLEKMALSRNIDPTGMSDNQLRGAIAGKVIPPKQSAGDRRQQFASTKAEQTIAAIQDVIRTNPGAVGVYGKGSTLGSRVAGALGQEASEDAKAAAKLKPLFTRLEQELGVMDAAGGQGGAGFAKQWKETLGASETFQTPELLNEILQSLQQTIKIDTPTGGPPPDDGWSIEPAGQ